MTKPSLSTLEVLPTYKKGRNDIAKDFYLPCMDLCARYDRAVGYFSSAVYMISWPSMKDFVERGCTMRLVCSPALDRDDIEALNRGYEAKFEEKMVEAYKNDFSKMLKSPSLGKPAEALAALVAMGVVDVRIAYMEKGVDQRIKKIFHEKIGIFYGYDDSMVVFKGSMNETWNALSPDGNQESVDANISWGEARERQRVAEELEDFQQVWNGTYPRVITREIPDAAMEDIREIGNRANWPELIDEICDEIEITQSFKSKPVTDPRVLRGHQSSALLDWKKKGFRGILKHATGSGKTFTALNAIRESVSAGDIPIVVVPSDLLLKQWEGELKEFFSDTDPTLLLCGGGNQRWRKDGLLGPYSKENANTIENPRIILTTIQTASDKVFGDSIRQGGHIFLVVDEVHRIGSTKNSQILKWDTGRRLGLSATPERYDDPIGTGKIMAYFERILKPEYTLGDAIKDDVLTPYFYYPTTVTLTEEEQEQWNRMTTQVKQLYAQIQGAKPGVDTYSLSLRYARLLINRARIAKQAAGKIQNSVEVISHRYQEGSRWIVYCDDSDQLRAVTDSLRSALGSETKVLEYFTDMEGDRAATLRFFENVGGILVSIRCLDEGVDIPSVSHALILASSKNPREFIQRRGRILRKYKGKSISHLHDVIVLPRDRDPDDDNTMLEGELSRAIEFGRGAENPACVTELERIANSFSVDILTGAEKGFEDDGEENEED